MKCTSVTVLLLGLVLAAAGAIALAAEPQSGARGYTYDELFGTGSDAPPAVTQPAAEGEGQAAPEPEAGAKATPESEADPAKDDAPAPEPQATAEPEPDPGEASAPDAVSPGPPARGEPNPSAQGQEDTPSPITNVFFDTDLRQALSDIAAQAGITIIPDATVQGLITADLQDVPLEDALRMVLVSGGYVFKQMNGFYLVGAPDPSNPNFHLLSETEVVELNYVDGAAIAAYLAGPYGRFVTVEGAPAPVPERDRQRERAAYRTPTPRAPTAGTRLFITAPREIIDRIKADLGLIDVPRTQVMLEAVVLEVSAEALKEIGIDWASRWVQFASRATGIQTNGDTSSSRTAQTIPASSLTYSELSFTQIAQLQALVQQGKAQLRANPRVTTIEGRTAEIEVGQEKYFAIVTGPVTFPYTTLEQIPAGITLRITPTVVEKTQEVIAQVEPEVRDVTGKGATGLPEITYRRATTNVRVRDGQSIIIGGLVNEFTTTTRSKFPLLGDIPLIGQLFRRVSSRQTRTEVVIVITPHILDETGRYPGQPAAAGLGEGSD